MILFLWNGQNRQMHRDRKRLGGLVDFLELEKGDRGVEG